MRRKPFWRYVSFAVCASLEHGRWVVDIPGYPIVAPHRSLTPSLTIQDLQEMEEIFPFVYVSKHISSSQGSFSTENHPFTSLFLDPCVYSVLVFNCLLTWKMIKLLCNIFILLKKIIFLFLKKRKEIILVCRVSWESCSVSKDSDISLSKHPKFPLIFLPREKEKDMHSSLFTY